MALLTRNVVIRGKGHDAMVRLGYGGRILVGTLSDADGNYHVGK